MVRDIMLPAVLAITHTLTTVLYFFWSDSQRVNQSRICNCTNFI